MKYNVIFYDHNEKIIFKGKPLLIPFKSTHITEMCIDLFGDPEPCVIHQSYAIQKLSDRFISTFSTFPVQHISLAKLKEKLDFVDINHIENCFLSIEVKP